MDERTARIALACAVEPGTAGVAEVVAEHGAEVALRQVWARPAPPTRVVGRLVPDAVPAMIEAQRASGVRILVPGDPEFPSQLLDLPEPPLALWVRGAMDLRMATLRSVAVVGARACTPYGERATAVLAEGLAAAGWTITSGGAFGIDAAAHRAALGCAGGTIAVLACGIDVAYPRAHDSLLCRIADSGAVVSELPPGSLALRHRFLARNRLIAAISRGTVVVEAARRSGAIATANRALELGRAVMAVPGPITSMASSGTNRLLHEGSAHAVSSSEEVVSVVLSAGVGGSGPAPSHGHPVEGAAVEGFSRVGDHSRADLPPETLLVLAALPTRGGRALPEIAAQAGRDEATCLAHLGLLEVAGAATRGRTGWRRRG
jgi:DNA processing protein